MPPPSPSLGLTITNPLVLYRTLLATRKIDPDPAQHRLALHLQKVYNRLEPYNPEIDYHHRLDQIHQAVEKPLLSSAKTGSNFDARDHGTFDGIFSSLRARSTDGDTLAITKQLTSHESAMNIQSPQGLLLYGDVGTGKSMLIDLLADCLPAQKRRRCHFNNFMLEIFAKLEQMRKERSHGFSSVNGERCKTEEHSLLSIARDLISTSPILFLDEFQLPDRAASKILTNLLTPFFHLGGVLIATSNRMPEELAKASGIEFAAPPSSRLGSLKSRWGLIGAGVSSGRSENLPSGKGDFALFLDVLRARCEIWDMEGGKDWRRRKREDEISALTKQMKIASTEGSRGSTGLESMTLGNEGYDLEQSSHMTQNESKETDTLQDHEPLPSYYFVRNSPLDPEAAIADSDISWTSALHAAVPAISPLADPHMSGTSALDIAVPNVPPQSSHPASGIPWTPTSLCVYSRIVLIPRHQDGASYWTFPELCCTNLGPADYISIASNFHTLILTEVPILTLLHKNEARRFITLLDALYEARCKLLIRAAASPDAIFFPEAQNNPVQINSSGSDHTTEAIYSETFAEIYQDQTSPFRPNTASTYHPSASPPSYPHSHTTRSILVDEDSDFGPNHHISYSLHRVQNRRGSSDGPPGAGNEIGRALDFSHTGAFTGEDERFAYKRAQSRLWEMCSARWWATRQAETAAEWWRPVPKEARPWEKETERAPAEEAATASTAVPVHAGSTTTQEGKAAVVDQNLFRHGASPFRVHDEPPPKFGWMHAWGMMRWGRKAGAWGKGVDGLKERGVGGEEGMKERAGGGEGTNGSAGERGGFNRDEDKRAPERMKGKGNEDGKGR